ncbi:MAG: hypothetical protein OXU37_03365 [Thaumarchaeota archaeon]|nr:hypothetical protein [Nitrososphaerota archaeon]
MATMFLDIETVPDLDAKKYRELSRKVSSGELSPEASPAEYWAFTKAALSPLDGRVMLITYQVDGAHVHRLKEWEDGEREILKRLYGVIESLQRGKGDGLRIVGHNIMRFDLYFLHERMRRHHIADEGRLYRTVLRRPLVVDFLQMHLPLNAMNGKGLKHDVLAHAYGLPTKSTQGSEEAEHYFAGEYEKILGYSEREFIYPQLYRRIRDGGLVDAGTLRRSIEWYDAAHNGGEPSL